MICMRCSHPPIWFHLHGKHSHDRTSSPVPKGPQSIHLPVGLSAMAQDSRSPELSDQGCGGSLVWQSSWGAGQGMGS